MTELQRSECSAVRFTVRICHPIHCFLQDFCHHPHPLAVLFEVNQKWEVRKHQGIQRPLWELPPIPKIRLYHSDKNCITCYHICTGHWRDGFSRSTQMCAYYSFAVKEEMEVKITFGSQQCLPYLSSRTKVHMISSYYLWKLGSIKLPHNELMKTEAFRENTGVLWTPGHDTFIS